jgi:hypothetical protein
LVTVHGPPIDEVCVLLEGWVVQDELSAECDEGSGDGQGAYDVNGEDLAIKLLDVYCCDLGIFCALLDEKRKLNCQHSVDDGLRDDYR